MSTLRMTRGEREQFLAGLHVGVLSVDEPGRAPLSLPIWYDFAPERGVWVITGEKSRKGVLLDQAGRFSLVAQTEELPYKYVAVEGPIVERRPADLEGDRRPMAHRYMGRELGDAYIAGDDGTGQIVYVMQPAIWRTIDYAKL